MKEYFTYILQSTFDSSFYIGLTENLEVRLSEHNNGLSKYTSKKKPWKIVYYEIYPNLKAAKSRESFLKKQRNRDFYQKLITEFNNKAQVGHPEYSG